MGGLQSAPLLRLLNAPANTISVSQVIGDIDLGNVPR